MKCVLAICIFLSVTLLGAPTTAATPQQGLFASFCRGIYSHFPYLADQIKYREGASRSERLARKHLIKNGPKLAVNPLPPGAHITHMGQQYVVVHILGGGAHGNIYEVENVETGQVIGIKDFRFPSTYISEVQRLVNLEDQFPESTTLLRKDDATTTIQVRIINGVDLMALKFNYKKLGLSKKQASEILNRGESFVKSILPGLPGHPGSYNIMYDFEHDSFVVMDTA